MEDVMSNKTQKVHFVRWKETRKFDWKAITSVYASRLHILKCFVVCVEKMLCPCISHQYRQEMLRALGMLMRIDIRKNTWERLCGSFTLPICAGNVG